MLKKTSSLLLFAVGFFYSQAQQTIPFRITQHQNIIVKTLVNKKDSLDLMFQISMKDASISPQRQHKADHIIFNKDEISDHNTVDIGKISLSDVRFFDNELTGHEADGKIGTGMFQDKTFKIDYDNSEFVIYDKKPDLEGYVPITVFYDQEQFTINADNVIDGNQQQEAYFLLQSGFSGALMYSNDFADEKELDKKLKIVGEKKLKTSNGTTLTSKQAVLPFFKLGKFVFKEVPVGYFTGEMRMQTRNYFGADMLRRFNWIFDADRKTAYIKPSKYYSEPYYKI